jgi:DNA replication ATP-dependent helicase Dna2
MSSNDCPKTPAPRLPLADLLGSLENASKPTTDISPDERVFWKHENSQSSQSRAQCTSTHRISKKRARSSSPASSPRVDSVQRSAGKNFDVEALKGCLRTPQADPANDLWNRYSTSTVKHDPLAASPASAFKFLLFPSSPRLPLGPVSPDSGRKLGRSISCVNEWPSSKRRRVGEPAGRNTDAVALARSETAGNGGSKLSRVSLLVDKIQESLTTPDLDEQRISNLSSSSPLPNRGDTRMRPPGSPVLRSKAPELAKPTETIPTASVRISHSQPRTEPGGPGNVSSSEFGDFDETDIDMSLLEGDHTTITVPEAELAGELQPFDLERDREFAEAVEETSSANIPAVVDSATNDDEFDEFDDGDDAGFAADLEDVFAKIDATQALGMEGECISEPGSKLHYTAPRADSEKERASENQQVLSATEVVIEELSDDEFGDVDFDDFDSAAAEAAISSAVPVRTQHSCT